MNVENIGKVTSYTSANALPIKLFTDPSISDSIATNKYIKPFHVQLVPTNRCNLKCKYCSFKECERSTELSQKELEEIVGICSNLGTKAITITGGGEPLLHPDINWLIENVYVNEMKVGLVSNGKDLQKLELQNINLLTWYRISFDTDRTADDKFIKNLDNIVRVNNKCDLAFSYVVTKPTDGKDLRRLVQYSNDNNFTHFRIVEDIFNPGVTTMEAMKELLHDMDTSKVVFQGKKEHVKGCKDCYISLVKPFIAADGYVYPCCGITYANNTELKFEPKSMRMGHYKDLQKIIEGQKNYDGSTCDVCYYPEYNITLNAMLGDVKHKEFI